MIQRRSVSGAVERAVLLADDRVRRPGGGEPVPEGELDRGVGLGDRGQVRFGGDHQIIRAIVGQRDLVGDVGQLERKLQDPRVGRHARMLRR